MKARFLVCSCLAGLAPLPLGACERGATELVPDQPVEPAGTTAAPGAASSLGEYRDDELPVSADFEAEADEQVRADNYLDELRLIEAEMGEGADAGTDAGRGADAGAAPPPDAGRAKPTGTPPPPATGSVAPAAKPSPPKKPSSPDYED